MAENIPADAPEPRPEEPVESAKSAPPEPAPAEPKVEENGQTQNPSSSPAPQTAETAPSVPQPAQKKKSKTWLIILIILIILLLPCCVCTGLALFSKSVIGDKIRDTVSDQVGEDIFENIIEEGIGGDVDIDTDDGTFSVETEEGSLNFGTGSEWPDSMPSDVPEFAYGTVEGNFSSEGEGLTAWTVSFTDVADNALGSYQNDLESSGWTITGTSTYGTMTTISAEKGTWTLTCSCTEDNDSCVIAVGEM